MKKRICAFILLTILIILPGCTVGSLKIAEFIPAKSFSLTMRAEFAGKTFSADIDCLSYNELTVRFTEPEELRGFTLTTAPDGYNVTLNDMSDTLRKETLPDDCPVRLLTDTMTTAVFTNHGAFEKTDTGYKAELNINGVPVAVSFGTEGFITRMECPSAGFSADFS